MPYIGRDHDGKITGVFAASNTDASEFIAPDAKELLQFLGQDNPLDEAKVILNSTDLALVRVIEDLINTLVDKGVILFTDLPTAAQNKLIAREQIRDKLNRLDNLLQDDTKLL